MNNGEFRRKILDVFRYLPVTLNFQDDLTIIDGKFQATADAMFQLYITEQGQIMLINHVVLPFPIVTAVQKAMRKMRRFHKHVRKNHEG